MFEDTKALLGDCTAGIELAVSTLDSVLPRVEDQILRRRLREGVEAHKALQEQAKTLLCQVGGTPRGPSPMARTMAALKTKTRMVLGDDTTAAALVAEGCGMGVASLCRSRNRYAGADVRSQALARSLLECEEKLSADMRPFL